jgi:hypothetical protein
LKKAPRRVHPADKDPVTVIDGDALIATTGPSPAEAEAANKVAWAASRAPVRHFPESPFVHAPAAEVPAPKAGPDEAPQVVSEAEAKAQAHRDSQSWAQPRGWTTRKAPKEDVAAFQAACRDEFDRIHAVRLAGKIACGDILEHVGDDTEGRPVYGETKNADRLRAIEWLANRAWGMPRQSVEVDLNPQSPQLTETGEVVMRRVMGAFAAHLVSAPVSEKQRFLALMGAPASAEKAPA